MILMLQRLRESLALILIALLPFHAFVVTVLTKWVEGPSHAPMTQIALWKEGMLAMILLIAVIELLRNGEWRVERGERRKFDAIDGLIVALILLGFLVSILNSPFSILNFAYGAKYDFIPLITFIILRRVSWSNTFLKQVMNVILCSGFIIALYGLISLFLPASFFIWLGYSDLHSLYVPDAPLAPFQQIGGTTIRRIQSVMSGPNQLGLWLLVPIGIVVSQFSILNSQFSIFLRKYGLLTLILFTALILSFSRAAWIGAAVIVGISVWPAIRSLSRHAAVILVSCVLCVLFVVVLLFPSVILRAASSRGHIENPIKAVQMMIAHPLGLGLGTAGPASNRTSDACVMLEEGSDPSWAKDRPDLCVFVGEAQVQPTDRECRCPFLPENWYLQIGVEMGWLGLGLYLALVIVVLMHLLRSQESGVSRESSYLLAPIFLALSGAALFLHAWEDSAVAYTVWMLIAALI